MMMMRVLPKLFAVLALWLTVFCCATQSANQDANDDDEVGMFLTTSGEGNGATPEMTNTLVKLLALRNHQEGKKHRMLQTMSMPTASPTAKSLKKKKKSSKASKKTTSPTPSPKATTTPTMGPTKKAKSIKKNELFD